MRRINIIILSAVIFTGLNSCDFLFGTREDAVVDEIFEEGAIDPELVQDEVGYVPVLPFWTDFIEPHDIFCGYDEMIYVVDAEGLAVGVEILGSLKSVAGLHE
ncbi:MAG TPA: hypothetical protein PKE14_14050 [Chitinophagales bacterium]|nr:hypothetical protein [Chitinophagales bacterium]